MAVRGDSFSFEACSVCSQCVHCVFTDVHRYCSATIIRMSGVTSGDDAAIWLSAVTVALNVLFTVC